MICSKSLSICNHSRARLVDSSRNRTFSRGYPNLMRSYKGLLELSGSKLALLKSTFNVENFICTLSWSISSNFDAVHSWNVFGSHKSPKKSLKTSILGFKVVQGHRCWYPHKGHQQCLLCSKSVSICNCSLARLDDSSRNRTLWRGTQIWCICTENSLNLGGKTLHCWNLRLMPNVSYIGCPGLSWMISAQFTLKMCIAA